VTFFDDTPIPLDGCPNKKNNPQWRRKDSKKPLKTVAKRKFPPKFHVGFALNADGGLSEPWIHAKRRKLKSGKNKGKLTFDHISMDQPEMMKCCQEMVIPFMQETKSQQIIFDCTTVYHNEDVYQLFRDAGIDVYPSAGHTFRVAGGYPPNSHETMPNEQIHDCFKEVLRKKFNALPESRQNMNSLYNQIRKTAKNFPKETIVTHIRKLPSVLKAIIEKNGARTKY
jgi:hypothetical protein